MRIGSYLVVALSLIATAYSVAVTAVGWQRILYYTGWFSSSLTYPAAIILYVALFAFAAMRCKTLARGAAATIIATLVSLIIWIFITAVDQYEGGAFVAQVTNWLGMKSIIVEETQLNIIAVLCGFLWPVTYFVSLLIATVITKRRPPKYLQ